MHHKTDLLGMLNRSTIPRSLIPIVADFIMDLEKVTDDFEYRSHLSQLLEKLYYEEFSNFIQDKTRQKIENFSERDLELDSLREEEVLELLSRYFKTNKQLNAKLEEKFGIKFNPKKKDKKQLLSVLKEMKIEEDISLYRRAYYEKVKSIVREDNLLEVLSHVFPLVIDNCYKEEYRKKSLDGFLSLLEGYSRQDIEKELERFFGERKEEWDNKDSLDNQKTLKRMLEF